MARVALSNAPQGSLPQLTLFSYYIDVVNVHISFSSIVFSMAPKLNSTSEKTNINRKDGKLSKRTKGFMTITEKL